MLRKISKLQFMTPLWQMLTSLVQASCLCIFYCLLIFIKLLPTISAAGDEIIFKFRDSPIISIEFRLIYPIFLLIYYSFEGCYYFSFLLVDFLYFLILLIWFHFKPISSLMDTFARPVHIELLVQLVCYRFRVGVSRLSTALSYTLFDWLVNSILS